jgi:uncharacterized protein involved in outer membrane biogenesis
MSNWLAYLGSIVVALLAALFAVPAMIDWNGYRGVFEEEATRVLGREVRLGGNVNLRLLPAPYVSFERMRISDPESQTGEPLFRTESFTMWLALSPLARGVLQANQIELKDPVLKLAVGEDGTGNWSRVRLTPGSLPFVPADVTLSSVKVSNGEIGLIGPRGSEMAKLEAINGELTADALTGPIRFRGHMKWAGEPREVRFATTSPGGNGDIQFKVSAAGTGSHSTYNIDGRASGLGGKLAITGELSAKIAPDLSAAVASGSATAVLPSAVPPPTPKLDTVPMPVPGDGKAPGIDLKPEPVAASSGAPLYDMRSKVAGSAQGFKLSEISISSQSGPPQLVTGDAEVTWGERTRVDLALNSRWIDLDAMFGTGKTVVPLEAARGLFDVLMRQLPASSDTNVKLAVDQLNLGADQISNVRFAAVRAGGPLEVKDFQVDLPGATHLSLGGKLAPGETTPKFEGTIGLKGQSLSRFLAWGMKRPALTEGVSDGAFAVNGNLKFSGKLIELSDAKVGIGDTPVTAGVRLELADRRRLAVKLEGQSVDIGRIWSGGLQMETLAPLIAHAGDAASKGDAAGAADSWLDLSTADLAVGIKAGTLIDGPRTLRNVEADVSIEGGKLAMRQLKFSNDAGLEVELEGEATNLRTAAQGRLRGLIVAPTPDAASAFVDLAGLDAHAPEALVYLQRLAPLRLAVTVGLGARTAKAVDLKVDGLVRGGRLIASADLDGGFAAWRASPVSITARIEATHIDDATSALLALPSRSRTARPGQILARATGTPQDGLLAFAAIEADGLMFDYGGKVLLSPESPIGLDGSVKVASRDAAALLDMAGLNLPSASANVPVSGTLAVKTSSDGLTLKPDQLVIAGTPVDGTMTLRRPQSGLMHVEADLRAGDITVPGLLAAILDGRSLQAEAEGAPSKGKGSQEPPAPVAPLWPEQAFDLSGLDALEGKVAVRVAKLSLQPGLSIANAQMDLALQPGRLAVTKLTGDALGGQLGATMTFAKEATGVALDGDLDLRVPQGEGKPDAAGFALKYGGRALSPAALIADLKGSGELKLADVSLGGMSPSIVGSVSEAALLGRGPQGGEALMTALRDGLRQGQLVLGEMTMPVTLGEGNLKLAKIELDRPEGRTSLQTVVELATLKLDSEWTIEARLPQGAGPAGGKMLPPVSVIYAGALQDASAIEPQISVAALERELTVRKMERDVEELERLRQEDEKRATEEKARIRAEQERIRQEKARAAAERAAAAAAAAVDDPQPAPEAAPGAVEQAPLPPAGANSGQPQPQSNAAPPNGGPTQQAAGAEANATPPATAATQPSPRPAPPRRKPPPPKENWNPFTQF